MADETLDVLIVGAGLSGIGAACHLQRYCPQRSFAIVEARERLGGTWDQFRYPGVRSDSDMHTLGYSFRPWTAPKAIADASTILAYLHDTAREHGVDTRIRYRQRVVRADWSTPDARWTVQIECGDGSTRVIDCAFLFMCSGYYDYAGGYQPDFPGRERFRGRFVHPQHWPDDLDCTGQRVLVIGSGATAVTLVPALSGSAAEVTMLQRSPTWMVARPSVDALGETLRRWLPQRLALWLTRWKNILLGVFVVWMCERRPERMRDLFLGGVRQALGAQAGTSADIATHFTPRYRPWEQRLCLVPDADFFQALKRGRARIVTDQIDTFTEIGVLLKSGAAINADVIVSATGLKLAMLGNAQIFVDGQRIESAQTVNYKGVMASGVPNLVNTFGYTRASWTLKADLTARWACRLLNHMHKTGARIALPPAPPPDEPRLPWVDFSSGYFQRAGSVLPRQGATRPWKLNQNYLTDIVALRFAAVHDGVLQFS